MKYNDTATDVLTERPTCDRCGERPAAFDCKSKHGPWLYACVPCFEGVGIGLGLGLGQRILIDPDPDV
jgi:hypothetical protein